MAGKPKGQKRAAKLKKRAQKQQKAQQQSEEFMPSEPDFEFADVPTGFGTSELPGGPLDAMSIRRMMERTMSKFTSAAGAPPRDAAIERAEDLVDQAMESSQTKAKKLARQALDLWPDCAEAYVILAECASSVSDALPLYEQGVAAGRRALADEWDEIQDHFWGYLPTRPFMRALAGVAETLWSIGRREESVERSLELLKLNPNDNQGIRMGVIPRLLELGRNDDCRQVLKQYQDGGDCFTAYNLALLEFRQHGDKAKTRDLLTKAFQANEHVPKYLVSNLRLPNGSPDSYSWQSPEEAQIYIGLSQRAWKTTPGAIAWMRSAWVQSDVEPDDVELGDLNQLPLTGECWLMYLVQIPNGETDDSGEAFSTLLWICEPSGEKCLASAVLSESPTVAEIRDAFTKCLADPESGLPRRPRRVEFLDADLCSELAADFATLGIEAVESEDDELREQVLARESQLCERESFEGDLSDLPIFEDEPWIIDGRQLDTWLTGKDGELQRPWAIVVVGPSGVLFTHLVEQTPTPQDWQLAVETAMRSPLVGEPHRPEAVFVRSPDHQLILAPMLGEIPCEIGDDFSILDELLDGLSASMSGRMPLTPYVQVEGMSVERVGQFFESAAQYYRRAPWGFTPTDSVWEVQPAGMPQPWYAVVIGQNGESYGLSLIETFDDCARMMNGLLPDGGIMSVSAMCLNYEEAQAMTGADLDAADQLGWSIAAPEAHPLVYRTGRSDVLETPSAEEFDLLEATLQTLPDFILSGKEFGNLTAVVKGSRVEVRIARVAANQLKSKAKRRRS